MLIPRLWRVRVHEFASSYEALGFLHIQHERSNLLGPVGSRLLIGDCSSTYRSAAYQAYAHLRKHM